MAISPFTDKELFNRRSFFPISHGHRRFAEIPEVEPPLHVAPAIAATAVEHDGLHLCRFMVVGSTAGMVEHMSMFPIDTIKTQIQAVGSCTIKSNSVNQAIRYILKSDGPIKSVLPRDQSHGPWRGARMRHLVLCLRVL